MAEQQNKGEQTLSPVTKSAEDVPKSQARSRAESSSQKTAGAQKTDNRAHPMQGRSLPYVTGAGAESYTDGQYASDAVNDLEHFRR